MAITLHAPCRLRAQPSMRTMVRRNAFLVLDLGLHVLDRVGALDLERDRLAGQGLDEDLHPAAQAQDEGKKIDGTVASSTAHSSLCVGVE